MKKVCCDCTHLSSYGMGTVECKRHPRQHVADPFEHVRSYVCNNFEPKFLSNPEPRILTALRCAQEHGTDALRSTLTRWFAGPPNDVIVATDRGLPLISVADGGLETFEHDRTLKSYGGSNHVFADVFGGVELRWPIVSYLSISNPAGARVETLGNRTVSVMHLGRPYSLAEAAAAFSFILSQQDIQLERPWFRRHLRLAGIDPEDTSFACFRSLPDKIESFLTMHRDTLTRSRTAVVMSEHRPDLEAIAEFLGMRPGEYGVLWCDARTRFHLTQSGNTEYEFAGPDDIGTRLASSGILAILAAPESHSELWLHLGDNVLSSVPTCLLFVPAAARNWLKKVSCFASFRELVVEGADGPRD